MQVVYAPEIYLPLGLDILPDTKVQITCEFLLFMINTATQVFLQLEFDRT